MTALYLRKIQSRRARQRHKRERGRMVANLISVNEARRLLGMNPLQLPGLGDVTVSQG